MTEPEHLAGKPVSPWTYHNLKCRCSGCRAAHAEYMRGYRQRRKHGEQYERTAGTIKLQVQQHFARCNSVSKTMERFGITYATFYRYIREAK